MLKQILQSGTVAATVEEAAAAASGADGGGEDGSQPETMKSFESVAALETADGPFGARCISEVAGIEIIKGKSGQIYLLSDKDRIIAKNTLIGGFGTGKFPASILSCFLLCKTVLNPFRVHHKKMGTWFHVDHEKLVTPVRYLPVTTENVDESRKVFLDWALGDRTQIQIDMQSLNADLNSFDIMSLYKYLTTVERQKRVTTHSVSYTEISRLSSSSGQDSFKVEPKNAHFYQTIPDSVLLRSLFDVSFPLCLLLSFLLFWELDLNFRCARMRTLQSP